jgi:hypothetical protein
MLIQLLVNTILQETTFINMWLFVKMQCHKNYGSATAERSFSVLRRLKTYVRSTMNNDRLSSLVLMHIHRDFSMDLDKVMEKFVSAKTRRTDFGQF